MNLQNLNVSELTLDEKVNTKGGNPLIAIIIVTVAVITVIAGCAIGYKAYKVGSKVKNAQSSRLNQIP